MSFLEKLFGSSKKKGVAPSPQEAIQRLREIQEMLNKKSEFLEKKVEHELTTAKKAGTKNKRVALAALKRKKRYEKQLQQIDGTLSTIEFQTEALENASTNTEVLKVMKTAGQALKGAHQDLDIDQVHDIMDDLAEQHEVANEISDAISQPTGFGQDYDEDELAAELEELEQEELDKQMIDVNPGLLPSVPSVTPAATAKVPDEDEELKELNAWAAA